MADKKKAGLDSTQRRALSSESLANAIGKQCERLRGLRALALSHAKILHQGSYEHDEADLGFCCEAAAVLLARIIRALDELTILPDAGAPPADPIVLAETIEEPRWELMAVQAVVKAVENLLRPDEGAVPKEFEANLRQVMETLVGMMEDVITALDPAALGLPSPVPSL